MSITQPETIDYTETSELEHLLEQIMPYEDSDDPNRRTHIINAELNDHVGEGLSAKEIVETARMKGLEVVALCGYVWIPKHNPEKFDACERCMKIAGLLMSMGGE